jgi:hypothetical protein
MEMVDQFLEISNPVEFLERPVERNEIDYKKQLNRDRKGKADFIMNTAAIANYGGGVLVFGVDGENLVGVDDQDLKFYDSAALQGIVQKTLSPIPKLSCEIVEHENKKFPFVRIASIVNAPILITRDFQDDQGKHLLRPGDVYIRQNTQTIKVHTDAQVRHLLEIVINNEVKKRLRVISPMFSSVEQKIINAVPLVESLAYEQAKERVGIQEDDPVLETLLIPKDKQTFTREKRLAAFKKKVTYTGHSYPHYATNAEQSGAGTSKSGFISWFGGGITKDVWRNFVRQNEDGSLCWICSFLEDEIFHSKEKNSTRYENAVGIIITLYKVMIIVEHTIAYLEALETESEWTLEVKLNNVNGRHLIVESFGRGGFFSKKECLDDSVKSVVTTNLETLKQDKKEITIKILVDLFQQFNWSEPNEVQFEKDIDESLRGVQVQDCYLNSLS